MVLKKKLCKILDTLSVNDNEPAFINPYFYHSDQMLVDRLSKHKSKLSLLCLNIQSINAKIDELRILIENLRLKTCHFSAICLQESWLSEHSDLSQFDIHDYTLISQRKLCCGHGGLIIYLGNNFDYTKIDLVENTKVWESLFIEVSGFLKKKIIIGKIYRPPLVHKKDHDTFLKGTNTDLNLFTNL